MSFAVSRTRRTRTLRVAFERRRGRGPTLRRARRLRIHVIAGAFFAVHLQPSLHSKDTHSANMSSLEGALDDTLSPSHITPKVEDTKDDIDTKEDVSMDEKPASDDGEEPAEEDDGMDLFGEEEVAEEVRHDDTSAASTPLPVGHVDN